MIIGAHAILYSNAADELRAFLRDNLGMSGVDAGGGWLIFALPPAELAVHPTEGDPRGDLPGQCELYLLCDDINATVAELSTKGVETTREVSDEGWGLLTTLRLPGGAELGLYEPRHPLATSG
jgi:hypothetical protein